MSVIENQLCSAQTQSVPASSNLSIPSPPPVMPTYLPREPHVPAPERYDGDLGTCQSFLLQCSLVFDLQPQTYATDKSKIAFIVGLLTGRARAWGAAVLNGSPLINSSYANFVTEMKKIFDHPVKGKDASQRLLSLRQGARSVAEYSVDFRTLAAESGWNDESLQGVFRKGLSEAVKDELAARDESDSLDDLVALAIRLDNRLRERRREKAGLPVSWTSSRPELSPLPRMGSEPPPKTGMVTSLPSSSAEEEPMQLGRNRLSPAERLQRVKAGVCIYCGQAGHFLVSCPLRLKGKTHQ